MHGAFYFFVVHVHDFTCPLPTASPSLLYVSFILAFLCFSFWSSYDVWSHLYFFCRCIAGFVGVSNCFHWGSSPSSRLDSCFSLPIYPPYFLGLITLLISLTTWLVVVFFWLDLALLAVQFVWAETVTQEFRIKIIRGVLDLAGMSVLSFLFMRVVFLPDDVLLHEHTSCCRWLL